MNKNFIILFIITFLIGMIFKYIFSFRDFTPGSSSGPSIELSLSQINLILNNDSIINFDEMLIKHLYEFEQYLLKDATYDLPSSKSYAFGSLYYLRYKEYLAARNLLTEINQNLYFTPRSNKHGKKIPILSEWINKTTLLEEKNNQYYEYQNTISRSYGNHKLFNSDYFNMNPSESILLEDSEQGKLIIYNPYIYNQKAKKCLKKSIDYFSSFLMDYKKNDDFSFKASIKKKLLNMYNNEFDSIEEFIEDETSYDKILKFLNDETNSFQVDLIDFLIQIEKGGYCDIKTANNLYRKIDDNSMKVLYKLKRKLFGLDNFNNRKVKNIIKCNDFDDVVSPVELYVTESELIFRSAIDTDEEDNVDWIDIADSKINNFWTKCIGVEHQMDMEQVCSGCLEYNNYDYTLLTSFRLGMWHGGELPIWNGRFNRIYTKSHHGDRVDPAFERLRDQIDLWMGAIIK